MCVAHFALEALGVNVLASFYSEICADAIWLTETLYPSSTALGPIEFITIELICSIVARFSNCTFLIVGGPPCQDVCRLGNKAGAFGSRSVFWQHFKRVFELFRTAVSDDSRVLGLMECTVMSKQDRWSTIACLTPFRLRFVQFTGSKLLCRDGGGLAECRRF